MEEKTVSHMHTKWGFPGPEPTSNVYAPTLRELTHYVYRQQDAKWLIKLFFVPDNCMITIFLAHRSFVNVVYAHTPPPSYEAQLFSTIRPHETNRSCRQVYHLQQKRQTESSTEGKTGGAAAWRNQTRDLPGKTWVKIEIKQYSELGQSFYWTALEHFPFFLSWTPPQLVNHNKVVHCQLYRNSLLVPLFNF